MTNSQVPRIELNTDDTISIMVDVYGFDTGTLVEVSGQATQENGAIASFYSVQAMLALDNEKSAPIWVRNIPVIRPKTFQAGFPVTIVVRASEAWITTLSADRDHQINPHTNDPEGLGVPKGAWKSSYFSSALRLSEPAAPASPPTVSPPDSN